MIRIVCTLYLASFIKCNESFAYPAPASSTNSPNSNNREPLYAPSICPENHLLYPGNQQTDWICDCAPGYVYYPEKDGCFSIYRQGPCPEGHYMFIQKGEFRPSCEINPCGKDGVVKYKGVCHPLEKSGGPCEREKDTDPISILTVVQSTLQLQCVSNPSGLSIIVVPSSCPPGSRRSHNGDCRTTVRF